MNTWRLKEYAKRGSVFHGSPNGNIRVLKPKQAIDAKIKTGFNVDKAVFASPSPTVSILFACISMNSIPEKIRYKIWSVESEKKDLIIAKVPTQWKHFLQNNKGYVYVLPRDSFIGEQEGSWQLKSKISVEPIEIVEVNFLDYERLGGHIIWVEKNH